MGTVESRPYRWPYHGELRPETTAILVFSDGSTARESAAVESLKTLVDRGRSAGMTVVHLPGQSASPVLDVLPGDLICNRTAFGGFTGTDLDLLLRGIGASDLLIAGFPVELGADCTMREANDLGYECLLLEDCCTALSEETRAGAVSSVQMSGGIFGAVARASDVLDAMAS